MSGCELEITEDNTEAVLGALVDSISAGLEAIGQTAEGYAIQNLKDNGSWDTGRLAGSVTHKVDEAAKVVYVGTNVEYGKYVEFGTGQYVAGGRPDPWVYQDAKGDWHRTSGQKPKPWLAPVADHGQEYGELMAYAVNNGLGK